MLAKRSRAHLLIVDMQEEPLARVGRGHRVLQNAMRLAGFARRLSVPITIGELEPSRLGATSAVLREVSAGGSALIGRTSFSCWRDELLAVRLRELRQSGRDQIVVCGLEAHVAVCQTILDLLANDFDGFLVTDATASASGDSHALALQRMGRCGAAVVDTEMIAYEWLEESGTPEFKDLVPLLG